MANKIKIAIVSVLIIIACLIVFIVATNDNTELKTIKSESQLSKIYKGDDSNANEILTGIFTMPFSILKYGFSGYNGVLTRNYYPSDVQTLDGTTINGSGNSKFNPSTFSGATTTDTAESSSSTIGSSSKDYSTTNIQVENVDEADITKTDGDYIYSISEDNVIITNVKDPENIKIEATIEPRNESVPEDLILYNDKLVIISTTSNSSSSYSSSYNARTNVRIYNIEEKSKPDLVKNYELNEPYYTSRCINNELYIISSGRLREENDKVDRTYTEDNEHKEIPLNNIKYLKDVKTTIQTIIAVADLDNLKNDIDVSSYLIDISNAYVSENSIYLLDERYIYDDEISIKNLFGIKGVFGLFDKDIYYNNSGRKTEIYKFDISKDGKVTYNTKTNIDGRTINQYSLDEQNGHLRIALYDSDGARVAIFNENLNQIGISNYVAKGETMYSSRFMGNKVYLVTYRNMDPLFVIDLSDETKPKVLGELKIPGYSTYLHPYDEDHIIGIGMETEEVVNKNSSGKVTSTTARIVGMKMALFDVSDVKNPEQISQTIIGDRRTTSAILTNPKALLFSKEKQLIAIPVNNYEEDFEVDSSSERVGEGYFVYNINLEDGFKLKGVITHETKTQKNKYDYYYYDSKLLRGMYIDNNLYTVSENAIKVNNLETLELISELEIKGGQYYGR